MNSVLKLYKTSVFGGRKFPEEGIIVGYTALIENYNLSMPYPEIITLISLKNKKYKTSSFSIYSKSYEPENKLDKQIVFALKYEGINLLFFKKLFEKLNEEQLIEIIQKEPSSIYSRKIWFLYEWLM